MMNMDNILVKTPSEIALEVVERVKKRRREFGYSQVESARRSGVSYGSIKRFEISGEIAFKSLIKIAMVLENTEGFLQLFGVVHYKSIGEVIRSNKEFYADK